jgi:transposase
VLDYETYCQIRDHLGRQQLSVPQTAAALGLDPRTVAKWRDAPFRPRAACAVQRASKLDPFKGQIVRWLDTHPYSAQQILQRLREIGFDGGRSIVKEYVARVRPRAQPAFLKLDFAPGECAQVDWGEWGSIAVGSTRRRLSLFVMVLCYSRRMYLEFTVSQTMEFFLACHEHAFAAFAGVPQRLMVDNLKSAVLKRMVGTAPVLNPKYDDFSKHWGFLVSPCNVRAGNEKGRVENAVGYVKKNFLAGLELADFAALAPAAQHWVDTVADVRIHASTHARPIERFEDERHKLRPLNPNGYDLGTVKTVRASPTCRVPLESNHYSVPPRWASQHLTLKAYPDRVCVYHQDQLVARHVRSLDRHLDIEEPEHVRLLQAQRASAREQRLMVQWLALSPRAQAYGEGLEAKRVNARGHIRKILALAEIHGREAVARAICDGLELQAFSAEYIANILVARRPVGEPPAPLQLTRRSDLLELELPEPDLSIYDRQQGTDHAHSK